jgi:hypothetical protein
LETVVREPALVGEVAEHAALLRLAIVAVLEPTAVVLEPTAVVLEPIVLVLEPTVVLLDAAGACESRSCVRVILLRQEGEVAEHAALSGVVRGAHAFSRRVGKVAEGIRDVI